MAKKVKSTNVKGLLRLDESLIIEETKDAINEYNLLDILKEYDEDIVNLTIRVEEELETRNMTDQE